MKTIPSFQIDHNILTKGIYISRIDDDITTYDIRMREPNRETVMTNAAMHTIEHIFATYVRNTEFGDNIITGMSSEHGSPRDNSLTVA